MDIGKLSPGTEQSVYAASRDASEATGVGTVLAKQNPGEEVGYQVAGRYGERKTAQTQNDD